MSTDDYAVFITDFAERHFIKVFVKKYKEKQWVVTLTAIKGILARYHHIAPCLSGRQARHVSTLSTLDVICPCHDQMVIKLDFAVAGTHTSPKASGNRLIAAVDVQAKAIHILLVYSKNEISPPHETVQWKRMIADNYPDFSELR